MAGRLPHGDCYPPRILRRQDAARYVGVSPHKFDELVKMQVFPKARRITETIKGWDRRELDDAVDRMPEADGELTDAGWEDVDAA